MELEIEMVSRKKTFISAPAIFLILFWGCINHSSEIQGKADHIYAQRNFREPLPPHIFKSDGCSCFPDGDWVDCCFEHDLAYWMGGSRDERKKADADLKKCVEESGYPTTAKIMYYGVRIGGVWWLPTPFRWGFGWDYPKTGPPGKRY